MAEFGSSAIPAPGGSGSLGYGTWAGESVRTSDAYSLAVVAQAIGLIANSIGALPMMVYRQEQNDQVSKAKRSWQYKLLHDTPCDGKTAFWFYSGITRSLLTNGNAYVLKNKDLAAGRVTDLHVLSPERVRVEPDRQTGELTYKYTDPSGRRLGPWTKQDVVHIVGETEQGAETVGVGVIQRHRQSIGAALAQEEYRASVFRNGSTPGIVIHAKGIQNAEQADEYVQQWQQRHQGVHNAHKPTVVPIDTKVEKIGLTLEDMAFVEMQKYSVSDVARMFSIPPALLGQSDVTRPVLEDNQVLFTLHALAPWMTRIEQAFRIDPDLFGAGPLYPEFLADALMRPSTVARYAAYLQGRQAGWLSVNDIRSLENMPPVDGGDEYQLTPVGGAPNLQPRDARINLGAEGGDSSGTSARELMRAMGRELDLRDAQHQRDLALLAAHISQTREAPQLPSIDVHVPDINVPAPIFHVHTPEQKPPTVRVNVPKQDAPTVNVEVPPANVTVETASPVVHNPINLPESKPRNRKIHVHRDKQGRAVSYEVVEEE